MFCLVAVASARPQLYNDYSYESTGSQSYSDISDENDPRFGFDVRITNVLDSESQFSKNMS